VQTAFGTAARAICEGEYVSARLIREVVEGMVPKPYAWGKYMDDREIDEHSILLDTTFPESDDSDSDSGSDPGSHWTSIASVDSNSEAVSVVSDGTPIASDEEDKHTYFFLGEFCDMDFETLPDPEKLLSMLAKMHTEGTTKDGMFGFPVPTVCGRMQRTVTWEKSWTKSFTHQLKDVIKYDLERHGPWPEFEAACEELITVVVPKLLDPLQAEGRELNPALIHGDFWEKNIALDRNTKEIIIFDPGCVYGHNEMEFGTCKCL
jgi:protein-ribulosamine 3-kinase